MDEMIMTSPLRTSRLPGPGRVSVGMTDALVAKIALEE